MKLKKLNKTFMIFSNWNKQNVFFLFIQTYFRALTVQVHIVLVEYTMFILHTVYVVINSIQQRVTMVTKHIKTADENEISYWRRNYFCSPGSWNGSCPRRWIWLHRIKLQHYASLISSRPPTVIDTIIRNTVYFTRLLLPYNVLTLTARGRTLDVRIWRQ